MFGESCKKWIGKIEEKLGILLYYAGYAHGTLRGINTLSIGISNQVYELKSIVEAQSKQIEELLSELRKRGA